MELLERQDSWLADLVRTLGAPTGQDHANGLRQLLTRLVEKRKEFLESDKMISWGIEMMRAEDSNKQSETPFDEDTEHAFRETCDYDSRFKYVKWVSDFEGETTKILQDLETSSSPEEANKKAKQWSLFYRQQKAELRHQIETSKKVSAPSVAAMSLMASALIPPFIGEFAKVVVERFVHRL